VGVIGVGLSLAGVAVMAVGIAWVLSHASHHAARAHGFRIVYSGVALATLGLSIFVVSRPPTILPFPGNLLGALLFFVIGLRFAIRAYRFRA
jgi:hypothetical protein